MLLNLGRTTFKYPHRSIVTIFDVVIILKKGFIGNVCLQIGERMERGCDMTCECSPGGLLDCSPRCKTPFIRRGRRLDDPLCFESPVDECCSIIACATGNGGDYCLAFLFKNSYISRCVFTKAKFQRDVNDVRAHVRPYCGLHECHVFVLTRIRH